MNPFFLKTQRGSLLIEYLLGFVLGGTCLFLLAQLLAPFWSSRSPRLLEVTCPETNNSLWAREMPCALSAQRFHVLETEILHDFSRVDGVWAGVSGFEPHFEKPLRPALAWGEAAPLIDPTMARLPPFDEAVLDFSAAPNDNRAITIVGYRGFTPECVLQIRQWDEGVDRITLIGYWRNGLFVSQLAFFGPNTTSPLLSVPRYTADPYHRAHWDLVRDYLEIELPFPALVRESDETFVGTRHHVFLLQP